MKKSTIAIIVVAVILIAIIAGIASSYNGVVGLAEEVDNKFATIDTMLQRRADLIPNLVNTVKGYTNQEQSVIDSVTEARAKHAGAKTVEEKANADQQLTGALNRLLLVVENYPDLKSSQNKKEGVIMTDSKELRRLIEEKGFKLKYVAERLGLSSYRLSLKIDNKQEFKTSEVSALCELLEIKSLEQKEKIFFNLKDDYKSTK